MSTQQTLFNPDDPRLTAYALGELSDAAERAQVEELLAASSEARAELADIRSLTAALTAEYEQERASAAAAEETTPANVVPMPRPVWRPYPLRAIAALLIVGGLAAVFAFPMLEQRRKTIAGPFFGLQQKMERRPRPQAAAIENDARTADGEAMASVAATPASLLLARNSPLLPSAPLDDQDGRALVVPPGQPLPTNLPPGATAVYGSPGVSGVVRGNEAASGGGGTHPLLLASDKESKRNLPNLESATEAGKSLAAAPPADGKGYRGTFGFGDSKVPATIPEQAPNTYAGTTSVATESIALDAAIPPPSAGQPAPASRAKAVGSTSSSWLAHSKPLSRSATRADAAGGVVVAGSNIPTSEEVGTSPVNTIDQTTRDRTGQKDVLPVITRSSPAIASGGGKLTVQTESTLATDIADRSAMLGDVPVNGRLFKNKSEQLPTNTADYVHTVENSFLTAKENPLSTFSIDVDTASYAIVRRFIEAGSLPPPDAVRVEEMLNYFPYSDAPPAPDTGKPFAIHLEAAACPWNTAHRLVRIGIKGKEMANEERPPSNLVFLLDVSGSMMPEERLPLIKKSLRLLVDRLREDDHVAIVVYAGESGLAMPPTSGDHKDAILSAIENLHAGGSTNGASGIKLAYQVARRGFIKGGTNRVILATDGDFNVGVTSRGDLLRLIEKERQDGVFLSVLGVGTDNLKDSTMQTLADHGNGNYNYIDRLEEGRKVLVNQMSGTLVTIAKDVKIQVEFNPAAVASYRLIGYEKRMLKKEDFNDDKIDAGEIGAGHHVTALYEVVPAGQPGEGTGAVDALKYQPTPTPDPLAAVASRAYVGAPLNELLTVKMRHKAPDSDTSERSYEVTLLDHGAPQDFANASTDFRFAAAVASFGMVLRESSHKGDATLGSALELAQAGKGEDVGGYRAGFIELVRQAQALRSGER